MKKIGVNNMYMEAKTTEDFRQIDEIERNKTPVKTGDIMFTTWGYDMTLNDYCKVLENTGKTVKCVMIDKIVTDDTGIGNGRSMPCPDAIISPPFRLHVRMRPGNEGFTYVGSYPYARGDTRKGYFRKWMGEPNYYNTWD